MAYSTPSTWVAGAVLTAAQLNAQIRDNLLAIFPLGAPDVAWTSFTPTLVQSVTVTKTVTRAKYTKIGRLVTVSYDLAVTGAGTAANRIDIGLPVTAAYANDNAIGTGYVYDQSANLVFAGVATMSSTTTFAIYLGTGTVNNRLGASGFTAGLANLDTITASVTYESAT